MQNYPSSLSGVDRMTGASRKTSGNCIVLINAAFLQEVKESFSELWEKIAVLRSMTSSQITDSEQIHHWVKLLAECKKELSSEFSLEETFGYISLDRATNTWEKLDRDASDVRAQHAELYCHLTELCEQVEEAQYRGTIVRDFQQYIEAFQTFDAAFRSHEQQEARFIEIGLGITLNS
jgi:hypothetical protein